MQTKIAVIEIDGDACLPPEEISERINQALESHGVPAEDVINIMQASSYTTTRIFYRKR